MQAIRLLLFYAIILLRTLHASWKMAKSSTCSHRVIPSIILGVSASTLDACDDNDDDATKL